jgi:hypothetical protein
MMIYYLVQLEANETSHDRSGGRDSRDDLASNSFRGMSISGGDRIVNGSQIGGRSDKIDVVVCIVILFELDRNHSVSGHRRW